MCEPPRVVMERENVTLGVGRCYALIVCSFPRSHTPLLHSATLHLAGLAGSALTSMTAAYILTASHQPDQGASL